MLVSGPWNQIEFTRQETWHAPRVVRISTVGNYLQSVGHRFSGRYVAGAMRAPDLRSTGPLGPADSQPRHYRLCPISVGRWEYQRTLRRLKESFEGGLPRQCQLFIPEFTPWPLNDDLKNFTFIRLYNQPALDGGLRESPFSWQEMFLAHFMRCKTQGIRGSATFLLHGYSHS